MRQLHTPRLALFRVQPAAIRRSAFTLIEMIVVMGIITAIIAVSWRLFKAPVGASVDSGARLVGTELRLARQYALANNAYVAVLLPNKANLSSVGSLPAEEQASLSNGAVLSCVVSRDGGTFTWEREIDGAQWKFLPGGIEIDDSYSSGMICDSAQIRPTIVASACRAIIFKPSGQLASSAGNQTFKIRPSSANIGAVAEEENMVQVTINWVTGKVNYIKQ